MFLYSRMEIILFGSGEHKVAHTTNNPSKETFHFTTVQSFCSSVFQHLCLTFNSKVISRVRLSCVTHFKPLISADLATIGHNTLRYTLVPQC